MKHWYMCVCCYFNTSINCVKLNAKVFLGPIFWLEPCLCSQFHPCAMSHSIRPLYILKLLTGEVNKIANFHNNAIFCSEMFGPSIYMDGTLTHTTHLNIAADQSHLRGYSTHNMYSITLQKTKQKNPPKSIQNGWSNMTKRPKCQSSNHFSKYFPQTLQIIICSVKFWISFICFGVQMNNRCTREATIRQPPK